MTFSVSEVLLAMNFSSVLNVTTIAERFNVYRADHLGTGTWTDWAIDWALWSVLEGLLKGVIVLWAERDAVLMHTHLILAAMFPIYIGSHASLRRPPSAAAPKKAGTGEDDDEIVVAEPMEGLTPSDAIMFPVLAGITLGGLYLLIKWLNDPALLNKILGWYFSVLGVFGVGKLAADTLKVGTSFIFPDVWSSRSNMRHYYSQPSISRQVTEYIGSDRMLVAGNTVDEITNPLPGSILSSVKFPESMTNRIWAFRSLLKSHWIFRGYLHSVFSLTSKVQIQDITGFMFGIATITLYNTWGKLWFLTNLIGFGFCYGTLQLMSPTSFWTGTLVLGGLFIYDITMVFYTPLMVTVATTLDVPIKLVFPGVAGKRGSMLGLGDIVLPGIMMALALRFDLYLHYLRKKTSTGHTTKKAEYADATGNWGERFWTWGANDVHTTADGARFKKVYFFSSLVGYLIGMLTTLAVLKIYNHAQPALLYLVPGVLIALWGTALVRGELPLMWGYTEDGSLDDPTDESAGSHEKSVKAPEDLPAAKLPQTTDRNGNDLSSFESGSEDESESIDGDDAGSPEVSVINGKEAKKPNQEAHAQHVFLFSLSAPKERTGTSVFSRAVPI